MQIREHLGTGRTALVLHPSGVRVTFEELECSANRLAHYFRWHGLVSGDTVAVIMENNRHMHAVMWAARRAGLYYTPVNTHLSAAEAAYIVENSDAKAVVGSAGTRTLCETLAEHLPGGLPPVRVLTDADLPGWDSYPQCVVDCPDRPIDDEREGDLLQYSSGTTGRPKGIRRELPDVAPAAAPSMLLPLIAAVGVRADSVYLSPAPLYHTAPSYWTMTAQAMGATTVVMEKFDPVQALTCIQAYRVTHALFVPAMFVRMLKLPEQVRNSFDLTSLQRVVHAAAPCPVGIKRAILQWWGPIVDEYYAASEAVGASFITASEWLQRPGSVGRPLVGTPHIVDEHGLELPAGEVGDIYYEGGHSFSYLNDAAKTASARDDRGWTTVGDVGYLDDDGYLYLTDRRHHVIISGGVNIYPQETEDILISHPQVMDAAVFGIPDDEMGQSVKAVVHTVDPADASEAFADELLTWLRDRLAHYKCPRSVSFEGSLPRSDAGKLYKRQLVEKYSAQA